MDRQWICIRGRKLLTTEFIHILDSYRCSFALRMRDDQVCKQYNAMICVLQELTSDYMEGKNHIGDQLSDFFKRCHMELPSERKLPEALEELFGQMESKLNIDFTEILDWCVLCTNEAYAHMQKAQQQEEQRILLKAIFIIGLSFTSDLDIRRIVSSEELREKIFFIEIPQLSKSNRKFLDKYGHVILCGVQTFCEDLNKVEVDPKKNEREFYFKSFRKMSKSENIASIQDRDIYDLFFKGIERSSIYEKDENRHFQALVNREKIINVITGIREGKSVIVHSDLGNGKTIFVNQIMNLCADMEFFTLKQIKNPRIQTEIKKLCNDNMPKVIICDPANVFLDILRKFADFDLTNIRFILVMRSSMYDNNYNNVYDVLEVMQNVEFMNAVNLDNLTERELVELDRLIFKYGFYGDLSGYSEERRIKYLKETCKSKFQNILLYLFEAMHILEKFKKSINDLKAGQNLRRILILTFVSSILELGLSFEDYKILLNIEDAERLIKRAENCGDFLDIAKGEVSVKSSIIAKEMMTKTDVFSKDEVFSVLTSVMRRLDKLYLGSEKYKNAMINLVSCSYISYVFGYKMDSSRLIEYYENVKELNFCRKNLFFWEQYAIICVNLNQFDRAERYFKTAYSLAKQKGRTFSAYQIDNHYARFLLENQLYYRKQEDSLRVFVEAHRLLNKNSEIDHMKKIIDIINIEWQEAIKNIMIPLHKSIHRKIK